MSKCVRKIGLTCRLPDGVADIVFLPSDYELVHVSLDDNAPTIWVLGSHATDCSTQAQFHIIGTQQILADENDYGEHLGTFHLTPQTEGHVFGRRRGPAFDCEQSTVGASRQQDATSNSESNRSQPVVTRGFSRLDTNAMVKVRLTAEGLIKVKFYWIGTEPPEDAEGWSSWPLNDLGGMLGTVDWFESGYVRDRTVWVEDSRQPGEEETSTRQRSGLEI